MALVLVKIAAARNSGHVVPNIDLETAYGSKPIVTRRVGDGTSPRPAQAGIELPTLFVVTIAVTRQDQIDRIGHDWPAGGVMDGFLSCLAGVPADTAWDPVTESLSYWQCGGQGFESPRLHPKSPGQRLDCRS